jgi:hypothetical protein
MQNLHTLNKRNDSTLFDAAKLSYQQLLQQRNKSYLIDWLHTLGDEESLDAYVQKCGT